jgi:hypothetical protein
MTPEQLVVEAINLIKALPDELLREQFGAQQLLSGNYACKRHDSVPMVAMKTFPVCLTCVLDACDAADKRRGMREPVRFKRILDAMQPLPPRINEKEPELNDTIVFFAVAMVNQMKTLWRFLPPTVSESTMAVLQQVADLSHQMSSDVLTAFCAVVNRYLRAYLPGSALIESGYTMKLLMMQPSGNNMLAFHSDAARHLKDVREIGSIFARNDKPGKLCFFHCERNHWVLFVVNTADKTFTTYNSA